MLPDRRCRARTMATGKTEWVDLSGRGGGRAESNETATDPCSGYKSSPFPLKASQQSAVTRILAESGFMPQELVNGEVDWFYNHLGGSSSPLSLSFLTPPPPPRASLNPPQASTTPTSSPRPPRRSLTISSRSTRPSCSRTPNTTRSSSSLTSRRSRSTQTTYPGPARVQAGWWGSTR